MICVYVSFVTSFIGNMIELVGDFRFELDMLLESVSSTAKRAEELLNNINENKISLETPNHIEDHFTGLFASYESIIFSDIGFSEILFFYG